VTVAPRAVTRDDLAGAVRAAFGSIRTLDAVARLAGGSQKGVYRLTMDDGTTAIAYLWEDSENFWPDWPGVGDRADQFTNSDGAELFEAAHGRLASLGLRVPKIYLLDRDHLHYRADIALVEDFPGEDLLALYERDPIAAAPVLARLREGLTAMRHYRGTSPGNVGHVDAGGQSYWPTCEDGALDFALRCLAEAARRDSRIFDINTQLEDRLREMAAAVRPRAEYSVVHGELGLDHVLVDGDGNPVIVDIENLMYFDVEWEHAHMKIRLDDDGWARTVGVEGLDEDRLAFYKLTQHLSLIAGPLRLLEGDFPDRDFMLDIAESNLGAALTFLER
jgi:Phosphotransferase enzyme family